MSIALVAALSAATVFYGGSALVEAPKAVSADKLREQAEQLLSAAHSFRIDNNRWPNNVTELATSGMLVGTPANESGVWTIPFPGIPTFEIQGVPLAECRYLNSKSRGVGGILKGVLTSRPVQCFGPSAIDLRIVASVDPEAIVAVYGVSNVSPDSALADPDSTEWLIAPNAERGTEAEVGGELTQGTLTVATVLRDFGSLAFGTTGALSVAVSNSADGPSDVSTLSLMITGQPFSDLTVSNTCPPVLAPGTNCNLSVVALAYGGEPRLVQAVLEVSDAGGVLASVPLRASFVVP